MNKILIIIFIVAINSIVLSQSAKIKVKVVNLNDRKGNVSIGLFNNGEGFPKKDSGKIGVEIPIVKSEVEFTFENLTNGTYAVAVYHDENKNGKLDRSFLGWPIEDYVFSNYAEGNFGPPSFENACFELKDFLEIILEFN